MVFNQRVSTCLHFLSSHTVVSEDNTSCKVFEDQEYVLQNKVSIWYLQQTTNKHDKGVKLTVICDLTDQVLKFKMALDTPFGKYEKTWGDIHYRPCQVPVGIMTMIE